MTAAALDSRRSPQELVDARYIDLLGKLVRADQLETLPPPEPLIDGILELDSLAWLHGKPGHGKTFVALDMAFRIATGLKWHGRSCASVSVLYIAAEGARGLRDRRRAWEQHNARHVDGVVTFLPLAVNLTQMIDVAAMCEVVRDLAAKFVVIDTQARTTVGAEENSATDMGEFIDRLDQIRETTGACVLVLHHQARGGDTLRGSTALEGAAQTVLGVKKEGQLITLTTEKQKDRDAAPPIAGVLRSILLTDGTEAACYSHDLMGVHSFETENEGRILAVLRESFGSTGASAKQLMDATGMPSSTFYRSRESLVLRGEIVNEGTKARTRYVISNEETLA